MKKNLLNNLIKCAIFLIALYQTLPNYSQALSGTYTIAPTGGNYSSFTAAVADLKSKGISGNVYFNVANGTYNEQIIIKKITGASSTNRVYFQGNETDSSKVILSYSATSSSTNYVVKFDTADYIVFRKITLKALGSNYGRVFYFNGGATDGSDYNTIKNCQLVGVSSGNSELVYSYTKEQHDTIQNSQFINGTSGIYFNGYSSDKSVGNVFINNKFEGQTDRAIYIYYQLGVKANGNIISMTSGAYGIYFYDCDGTIEIQKNKINVTPSNGYGISINNCDATSTNEGIIANNFVSLSGSGRGIDLNSSYYQNIYFNSVYLTGYNSYATCFYSYSNNNLNIRNNIFANSADGYAYYFSNVPSNLTSDYNDYYSNGNYLAYWGSSSNTPRDVAGLRALNGQDANSFSANPLFTTATDLHTTTFRLDGKGTNVNIATDIDGNARNATTPDIGAVEFTGTGAALTGTYSIGVGGAVPNYATFAAAITDLAKYGISGNVFFNIVDGTYNEQISIPSIDGTSSSSTITFQSASNDPAKVKLQFQGTSGKNYVVDIQSADYLTFKNITFNSLDLSYSRIFAISGSAKGISITYCNLNNASNSASDNNNMASIYSNGAYPEILTIDNCNITGGAHGIYVSNSSLLNNNLIINKNTFTGQYFRSVYIYNSISPKITGNIFDNTVGMSQAICLSSCAEDYTISKNKIKLTSNGDGILLYYSSGTSLKRAIVSNNLILLGGTSSNRGISTESSAYISIYYNTVKMNQSNNGATALNVYYTTNLIVKNNIFSNFGGGYACYYSGTFSFDASDNNDLYTVGNYLAYWSNSGISDLAAYKTAASTQDVNTVSFNPVFLSPTDLHASSSNIDGKATPIASIVSDDIDGDARSATNPDIGADEFTGTGTALSGTYSIGTGGTAPNFPTFTDAANALNNYGVSASVTFNVLDATYDEQISLLNISGTSASNTVTFQSASNDSSKVILSFATTAAKNYVVELQASRYIIFKKMTFSATSDNYSRIFSIKGYVKGLSISNCVIDNAGASNAADCYSIYSNEANLEDFTLANSIINGGSDGVYIYNSQLAIKNTLIQKNVFAEQQGVAIYINKNTAPKVIANVITNITYKIHAIELVNCSNNYLVSKNKISLDKGGIGLNLDNSDGTNANKGLISNNFVSVAGDYNDYGINLSSVDFCNVYFNTVKLTSTYYTSSAFIVSYGSQIVVQNNIFTNFGGGYAYTCPSTGVIVTSNYNDLFTTGSYIGNWNSVQKTDLAAFAAANGKDINSVSCNPIFASASDLHSNSFYLDSAATPITGTVPDDIDGETRSTTKPDIGADEFTATAGLPLNGTLTIGGATPNYTKFADAINDLNTRGINGSVIFKVRNGTYNEQLDFSKVTGASATKTVTFQSESGDSTGVIVTYKATSASDDYVVKFTNCSYITLKNMTFSATGSSYARVILINGGIANCNILNNVLSSIGTVSAYAILSDNNFTNNLIIKNNVINEAYYGIHLNGDNTLLSTSTQIINNIITGSKQPIFLWDQESPVISGNSIISSRDNFTGIYVYNCDFNLKITRNKVVNNSGDIGIQVESCNGNTTYKGLISDNFISMGGSAGLTGLYINNSDYQRIYFNSINVSSSSTYAKSFYISNGTSNELKNNIIANTGAGYAYYNYNNPNVSISASDFNNIYTKGAKLAYWDGVDRTDLNALKTASTMDGASLALSPLYASATDPHVTQKGFQGTATPISEDTIDLDGNLRDKAKPDIGAIEFTCSTPVFSITTSPVCLGDSMKIKDNSKKITYGATYNWDFNNDQVIDTTTTLQNATFKYLYKTSGTQTVKLSLSQIAAGCNQTHSFNVTVYAPPALEIIKQGVYCDSANGKLSVNATGGAPFKYAWSNGNKTSAITGLSLGTYTIAVTDTNNCVARSTVDLKEAMTISFNVTSGSSCGKADGKATATVTGGVSPYTYIWSSHETEASATKLSPGAQYLNVIDKNGCNAFGSVIISNVGGPQISATVKNNTCPGDLNGDIKISVTGGKTPYKVLWSNGATDTLHLLKLAKGVYSVTVKDNDTCLASQTYEITEPPAFTVSPVVANATCGISDGKAVIIVNGGTAPYKYSWLSGRSNQIETGLSAGIYPVTITDAKLCTFVAPVIIDNVDGPKISVASKSGVTCTNSTAGSINVTVSGGTPNYTYSWTGPGNKTWSTEDITGLAVGSYNLTVTDDATCKTSTNIIIEKVLPPTPSICMVSVDTILNNNMIIWQKTAGKGIEYYNIYKESNQSGIYVKIDTVRYDRAEMVYTDKNSNPLVRSWRYKISAVDSCKNESALSSMHKTMHLTSNIGLNNVINLIWDHYEGFEFSSYRIYRLKKSGWEMLEQISNNLFTYTDTAPKGVFEYQVAAVKTGPACDPTTTIIKSGGDIFDQSVSNIEDNRLKGSGSIKGIENINISCYPNPYAVTTTLTYNLKNSAKVNASLYDAVGRLVVVLINNVQSGGTYTYEINASKLNIKAGIYTLKFTSGSSEVSYKLIQTK